MTEESMSKRFIRGSEEIDRMRKNIKMTLGSVVAFLGKPEQRQVIVNFDDEDDANGPVWSITNIGNAERYNVSIRLRGGATYRDTDKILFSDVERIYDGLENFLKKMLVEFPDLEDLYEPLFAAADKTA